MRAVAICLILAAWAAWPAHAAEKQSEGLMMVSFTSHVCKTKLEPGTPGSSPQMPIVLDRFDDLHDDAAEAKAQPEGKPPKPSQYECKWVQLPGYMTWTNYYHYRGYLYASAWEAYGSPEVTYIVERFADKSARRFGLLRRQMTVVGRFYDLCAAADRAEKESGQHWWLFGPCHYGENKGMMLTDVTVKHVHDDKPQYLSGENNRALINDFPRVDGADLAPLESRTRDWVASIKRGLAKHAQETLANHPVWKDAKKKDRQEVEKDITDADGYAAYLPQRSVREEVRMGLHLPAPGLHRPLAVAVVRRQKIHRRRSLHRTLPRKHRLHVALGMTGDGGTRTQMTPP